MFRERSSLVILVDYFFIKLAHNNIEENGGGESMGGKDSSFQEGNGLKPYLNEACVDNQPCYTSTVIQVIFKTLSITIANISLGPWVQTL